MVHLKNGYVISIGRKKSKLLHIPTGSQTELSFVDLQSLQALALGRPVDAPTLLTRLSQEDLLVEGPPPPTTSFASASGVLITSTSRATNTPSPPESCGPTSSSSPPTPGANNFI